MYKVRDQTWLGRDPGWSEINSLSRSALLRAGLRTPEVAGRLRDEELLLIDGFGPKGLRELRAHLKRKNTPIGVNLEPR